MMNESKSPNFLNKAPSLDRFFRISKALKEISLTRFLQNELIRSYRFKGSVLDFGGGDKAQYSSWLKCQSYKSVNIDPMISPTWVIDINKVLPCADNSFDSVISFNTLEHIYDVSSALNEMKRVLKSDGELFLITPFLHPIHGHPNDFFRPTGSWYKETLIKLGFQKIEVISLSWGPFSTGQMCSGVPGKFKIFRRNIALLLDLLYFNFLMHIRSKPLDLQQFSEQYATSFVVRATKKE
jgi:SAM-dependent methyltransferase